MTQLRGIPNSPMGSTGIRQLAARHSQHTVSRGPHQDGRYLCHISSAGASVAVLSGPKNDPCYIAVLTDKAGPKRKILVVLSRPDRVPLQRDRAICQYSIEDATTHYGSGRLMARTGAQSSSSPPILQVVPRLHHRAQAQLIASIAGQTTNYGIVTSPVDSGERSRSCQV
jgi:hypothetical protein